MIHELGQTFFITQTKDAYAICNIILPNADQHDRKQVYSIIQSSPSQTTIITYFIVSRARLPGPAWSGFGLCSSAGTPHGIHSERPTPVSPPPQWIQVCHL